MNRAPRWLTAVLVASAFVAHAVGCGASPGATDAGPDAASASQDAGTIDAHADTGEVSFRADVHPVLMRECARCHASSLRGDFRTAESAHAALMDPSRGTGRICNGAGETPVLPSVVPSDPDASGLWRLISVGYHGCAQLYGMPKFDPRGLLIDFDPDGAESIRAWIAAGARMD